MPDNQTRLAGALEDANSPALTAFAITPGATALATVIRQITIGGNAGVLQFKGLDGKTYITAELPAGTYPVIATHILAGTTATKLTGWS